MGTRHLTVVKKDNQNFVAQYGQWDGYPSGQGLTIIKFLQNLNIENFKSQLNKCTFLTEENGDEYFAICYKSINIQVEQNYMTMEESERFKVAFPELHRDTGANILNIIKDTTKDELFLKNDIEFKNDTLFCEYIHELDFDTNEYKIFVGGQKKHLFKTKLNKPITVADFVEKCTKKGW